MRKRQRKKNEKKYLPVICDEFNLILMTAEEREEAWRQYESFRKKYAFRKRYKDLKKQRCIYFYMPMSKSVSAFFQSIAQRSRKNNMSEEAG